VELPAANGGSGGATASGTGGALADDPGTAGDGSFMIGPTYKDAPEFKRGAGVPQGKTFTFTFAAKDSKIYPKAIDRKVTVYRTHSVHDRHVGGGDGDARRH